MSPPPPAFMRSGDDSDIVPEHCCARVREVVDPAKPVTGVGKKAEVGPQQAAKMHRDVVLMLVGEADTAVVAAAVVVVVNDVVFAERGSRVARVVARS